MKTGLIVPANLKYSPYVNYYIDVLKKQNADYRLIVWDKTGTDENADMTYSFRTPDENRKKILAGHLLFARKCRQYIQKEHIDHLIVFTLAPLFFLGLRFLRRFSGKLIMDVRDDSPFRSRFPGRLNKIRSLAHTLVVSSPRFSLWFDGESFLCHNADMGMLEKYDDAFVREKAADPVRLVFAGMMIEEDVNIQAIQSLAGRKEFELVFIGRDNEGKEKIKRFVRENGIGNVSFEGEYRKEDIVDIYRSKADLVNILRQKTTVNRNALPNKLYDAVLSGIPLAVFSHNEAIADYVSRYHLGILLDEQGDIGNQLSEGIRMFDYGRYRDGRKEFLQLVRDDHAAFENRLVSFCLGE